MKSFESQPQRLWIVNKLFGPKHWCNQWVTELCIENDQFLNHLSSQVESYTHYLAFVKIGLDQSDLYPRVADQALAIMVASRKALLQKLYGQSPTAIIRSLKKLGSRPLNRSSYKQLTLFLRNNQQNKGILHTKRVYPEALAELNSLPKEMLKCALIFKLKTPKEAEIFCYMLKIVSNYCPEYSWEEISNSLKRVSSHKDFTSWFENFLQKAIFPSPPWQGNNWIHPISSNNELKRNGVEMNNCIHDSYREVLQGECYFFRGRYDSIDFVLKLQREGYFEWSLDEALGENNSILSKPMVKIIEQTLCKEGFGITRCEEEVTDNNTFNRFIRRHR